MNGKEVFSFAVSKVPEAVKELLSREQVSCEDISYYLLHQANERIIRSAARRLGEDISKFSYEYGQIRQYFFRKSSYPPR